MTFHPQARAHQALSDLAACAKVLAMCDWIIETATNPQTREWAQQERDYFTLRAESDRGIAANPEGTFHT
jgi:hypothetical protein